MGRVPHPNASTHGCSMVDCVGVVREIRLLVTKLQTDRFYAFYFLIVVVAVTYLIKKY